MMPEALYITPGNRPPVAKQLLAEAALSGPVHVATEPGATRPDSKVSVGSPGAETLKAALLENVTSAACTCDRKRPNAKAHRSVWINEHIAAGYHFSLHHAF